jgi:phosphoribosyl 1,2-cyclic phosphodiesterase
MAKIVKQARQEDFIKFLGTAGARFVMIKQMRASGGLWVSSGGNNILIDPGPGSLVRCASSRPKLDPGKLDACLLTHRHLDHSNDINVMIEAMTEGGFKKRGVIFCPEDAISDDPVILKYARGLVERIEILKDKQEYSVGSFKFKTSMKHIHSVMTYGLKFNIGNTSVSILTDTRYFDELVDFYRTDVLIICVVLFEPRPSIDHLCFADVERIIGSVRPKKTIMTHFGMSMLKEKPQVRALELSQRLGLEVQAAYDGMTLNFS